MKKLMISIMITLFLVGFGVVNNSIAGDKDEVKYEVTLHIVYNALTPSETSRLLKDQLEEHKDACKVETGIKKADTTDYIVTYSTDDDSWVRIVGED